MSHREATNQTQHVLCERKMKEEEVEAEGEGEEKEEEEGGRWEQEQSWPVCSIQFLSLCIPS